jgi:hypothetical protein
MQVAVAEHDHLRWPQRGVFTSRIDPERETRRLIAKLQALGHTVTLAPAA